jgi:hypothetical protein
VLVPIALADTLLHRGRALTAPLWSERILGEAQAGICDPARPPG